MCFTNSNTAGYRWYTDGTNTLNLTSAGAATFTSSVTATALSIANNFGGITLSRTSTTGYSTILYQNFLYFCLSY